MCKRSTNYDHEPPNIAYVFQPHSSITLVKHEKCKKKKKKPYIVSNYCILLCNNIVFYFLER